MPSKLFSALFPDSCIPRGPVSSRCKSCNFSNLVPSDGPADLNSGGILFIGEAPGENEDAQCIPFIGASGQEFNERYLPLAGLHRKEVTITNVVKCRPPGNRTPAPSQIRTCSSEFLIHEIMAMRPKLIVPMGGVALRFVNIRSTSWDKRPSDPKNLNLEAHHGRIFHRVFDFMQEGKTNEPIPVFPVYHPAAGLRDGSKMTQSFEDFRTLEKYLTGKLVAVEDEYPAPDYREIQDTREYDDYLSIYQGRLPLYSAIDTEDDEDGSLYSIQISHAPGTAVFIDAKNDKLVRYVKEFNNNLVFMRDVRQDMNPAHTMIVVFHYAFHDWSKLTSLGWNFSIHNTADTLQEAFQSGVLPKKLKALAYRLCGVTMTSFHDLVYPYSVKKSVDFLENLARHPNLQPLPCYGKKGQVLKKTTSNPIASDINRMLRCIKNSVDNPDEDVKPYEVWKKWQSFVGKASTGSVNTIVDTESTDRDDKKLPYIEWLVKENLHRMPKFSIRHVPRNLAVQYGCRDADVTGRAWLKLRARVNSQGGNNRYSSAAVRKDWIK